MGDLTKRLSRYEFACRCGCGLQPVDYELVINLEDCADHFEEPDTRVLIHINSGNRCISHDRNVKIKIAKDKGILYIAKPNKSQHLFGLAADFWMELRTKTGLKTRIEDSKIADYLETTYIDKHGIGRYSNRTHYDVRTNGPARWTIL